MIDPQRLHRVSRWFRLRGHTKIPELIRRLNFVLTHCDLPGDVKIGRNVRFQHFGSGVVVFLRTEIGDDVMIHPQVVIGQNTRRGEAVPLDKIVIGNRVMLGAGAKIIASGQLTIGDDVMVGANAVVLRDVPAGALAVGVPARIVMDYAKQSDRRFSGTLPAPPATQTSKDA